MHSVVHSLLAQVQGQPAQDFPGQPILQRVINWGMYLSLALSLGSILYGAGSWAWSRWGNAGYASNGRSWVMGGVVGALLAGLSVTIVNQLFTAASGT